jgi:hypothetical protein
MGSEVVLRMRARVRAVHGRAAVQRWSYRQRHLAAGVWFRLRRTLADAREAYVVSDDDARRLVADGYVPERAGLDLSPEKTILMVDETRVSSIASRRPVPVRLGPELLTASAVVLVPFDAARAQGVAGGRRDSS